MAQPDSRDFLGIGMTQFEKLGTAIGLLLDQFAAVVTYVALMGQLHVDFLAPASLDGEQPIADRVLMSAKLRSGISE